MFRTRLQCVRDYDVINTRSGAMEGGRRIGVKCVWPVLPTFMYSRSASSASFGYSGVSLGLVQSQEGWGGGGSWNCNTRITPAALAEGWQPRWGKTMVQSTPFRVGCICPPDTVADWLETDSPLPHQFNDSSCHSSVTVTQAVTE